MKWQCAEHIKEQMAAVAKKFSSVDRAPENAI